MIKLEFTEKLPKKEVDKIKDPKKRLSSVFSYYRDSEAYKNNKKNLHGLLNMIDGLEYHYENHCIFEKKTNDCSFLKKSINVHDKQVRGENLCENVLDLSDKFDYGRVSHEAVAYFNRLGQLYYLFKSKWFTKDIGKECSLDKIPLILSVMPIRNKIGAHRQQDYPRDDDDKLLGFNQMGLFPQIIGFGNNQNKMNITYSFSTKPTARLLGNLHAVEDIEYLGEKNNVIMFNMTKCHKVIINEIFSLIEYFFTNKS